ncbi:glycosyl hydrolase family 28-related protein [Fibrisoma montanum]|uniref:glycosyl hydrolase family 28-related protein n=1 Tax=Fibrisoma montanum TaxID=2305895 RepID=UPI001314B1E0|nr:glycosyl hydrolase family 28-related protein [Fibrisoma montanum]
MKHIFTPTQNQLILFAALLITNLTTSCTQQIESIAPQETPTSIVIEEPKVVNVTITVDAIDVKAFGAKGDGQADDTEAITKALKSGAGKQVLFPEGTYKVTKVIKLEVSNIEIAGLGKSKILSTERTIIDLGNVSNVSFKNLSFESTNTNAATYYFGLMASNRKTISGLSVSGCTFSAPNCSTAGIKLVTDAVGSSVKNISINNCTFNNIGNMAIEIQNHLYDGIDRFSQIEVSSCTFSNLGLNENAAYHYGMAVSFSGKGSNLIVADNRISNPYDIGIELAGSIKNAQIVRNQLSELTRMNKEANRPLSVISISSSKGDMHENIQIIANQNLNKDDKAYIFFGNVTSATVENNKFNTMWFMQLRNVSNSTFKNNQISSRGGNALLIESTNLSSQNNQFLNSTFSCDGNSSAEAVVKFKGSQTNKNTIVKSQLIRSTNKTVYLKETDSASKNELQNCTFNS